MTNLKSADVLKLSLIVLLLNIQIFSCRAQTEEKKVNQYIIPEAPAYTFLGVTPANITRPTTPRALGTALINGIDAEGRVKQGIALDISPWVLIPNLRITLRDYQKGGINLKYILANTQVSIATTKASITNSSDVAYGVRLIIFDSSDPMRDADFTGSLVNNVINNCPPSEQPGQIGNYQSCIENELVSLRETWTKDNWNKNGIAIASAGGWRYEDGIFDNAKYIGQSVWVTGALPVDKFAQLVGQVKYDWLSQIGDIPDIKRLSYGTRLIAGSGTFNIYGEIVGVRNYDEVPASQDKNSTLYSGGIEFKVADKIWIATGVGKGYASFNQSNNSLLLANLRWDVSGAPAFKQ